MSNYKFRVITLITAIILGPSFFNCFPASATRFHTGQFALPVDDGIKKLKIAVDIIEGERKFWKSKSIVPVIQGALTERYKKEGFQVVGPDEKFDVISQTSLSYKKESSGGGEFSGGESKMINVETFIKARDGTVLFRTPRTTLYSTSFAWIVFVGGGTFFSNKNYIKSCENYGDFLIEFTAFSSGSLQQFMAANNSGKNSGSKKTDFFRYTVELKNGTFHKHVTIAMADEEVVIADNEGNTTILQKNEINSIKLE